MARHACKIWCASCGKHCSSWQPKWACIFWRLIYMFVMKKLCTCSLPSDISNRTERHLMNFLLSCIMGLQPAFYYCVTLLHDSDTQYMDCRRGLCRIGGGVVCVTKPLTWAELKGTACMWKIPTKSFGWCMVTPRVFVTFYKILSGLKTYL